MDGHYRPLIYMRPLAIRGVQWALSLQKAILDTPKINMMARVHMSPMGVFAWTFYKTSGVQYMMLLLYLPPSSRFSVTLIRILLQIRKALGFTAKTSVSTTEKCVMLSSKAGLRLVVVRVKNCPPRRKTDLVAECLFNSRECIQDETVDRHNALHLAVVHDRFEVLQVVLTGWIQRMSQRDADSIEKRVLNKVDIDYNTPLHLMLRLLLECRSVERNKVNGDDLTFLDILRSQGPRVVGEDLDLEEVFANTGRREDFEKIEDATVKTYAMPLV
ncbi:hypothetical protein YC2023_121486 [Brassica napus]